MHLRLALEHHRQTGLANRQASALSNLGLVEIELGNPEGAIGILTEALALHEELELPRSRARILSNLGFANEELGNDEQALRYHGRALELRRELNDEWGKARTLGSMAKLYLSQAEFALAEEHFEEALVSARAADARSEQAGILQGLSEVFGAQGRWREALDVSRQEQEIRREINKEQARGRLADLEQERQVALTELELTRQAQQQSQLLTAGAVMAALVLALLLYARSRARLLSQVRQKRDELEVTTARLRESEQHYRDIFDDAVVPKLLIDVSTGHVLELNGPAHALCGPSIANSQRTVDTLKPGWLRRAASDYRHLADTPICRHEEWQGSGKSLRHAQVWLSPTQLGGRACALLTVHDVTDDKRLEEDRIRISQLESLGSLAGGIAHDFNNALMAVLGNVSMAQFEVEEDSEAAAILDHAERAVQHATELTAGLLVFSKGGAPQRELHDVGNELAEAVRFAMSGSAASVTLEIEENLWAEVDAGQFQQAISNLVINAVQAMGGVGEVTICASRASSDVALSPTAGPGDYVRIDVGDHGPGIAPEVLDRVFDPYFSTKASGLGLGLASAYAIATRHGGWIAVDSSPGRGATFTLYFPASEAGRSQLPLRSSLPLQGRGNVLVMDDDPAIRAVYSSALRRLGYQVTLVERGEAAVENYSQAMGRGRPFDLVILDLTVPGGMGGRRTLDALVELDRGVLAIVASGYSNDPVMSGFREAGFVAALRKPFSIEALGEALREVLSDRDHGSAVS